MNNKLALKIQDHQIVQDDAFVSFVKAQKELQDMIDEGWEMVKQAMIAEEVKTVKGKWGFITLGNKKTYVSTGPVDPSLMRMSLDSKKIDSYVELFDGALPTNVTIKRSLYLAKKVNPS